MQVISCARLIAEQFYPRPSWTHAEEWHDMDIREREMFLLRRWEKFVDKIHATWAEQYGYPRGVVCKYCGAVPPPLKERKDVVHRPDSKTVRVVRRGTGYVCVECWAKGRER